MPSRPTTARRSTRPRSVVPDRPLRSPASSGPWGQRRLLTLLLAVALPTSELDAQRHEGPERAAVAAVPRPAPVDEPLSPGPLGGHRLPDGVRLVSQRNGRIEDHSLRFGAQLLPAPRLTRLRRLEDLDDVVRDAPDEWQAQQALARWTYDQWSPGRPAIVPHWDALEILWWARSGRLEGWCAQYAVVLVQACLSLGWQARYVSMHGPGAKQGHVSVEVWSNQFNGWALLDPFFGAWMEDAARPGRPLSALEVHQARTAEPPRPLRSVSVGGDPALHPPPVAELPDYALHLAVAMRNDHASRPLPAWTRTATYLAWRDGHSDGRPEVFTRFEERAEAFDFPLNQVEVVLRSQSGLAPRELICQVRTNMVNLESLELQLDDQAPRRLEVLPGSMNPQFTHPDLARGQRPRLLADLTHGYLLSWSWRPAPGLRRLSLRAVSSEGVRGPATVLELQVDG